MLHAALFATSVGGASPAGLASANMASAVTRGTWRRETAASGAGGNTLWYATMTKGSARKMSPMPNPNHQKRDIADIGLMRYGPTKVNASHTAIAVERCHGR